mmetsp:Transcript_22497/g.69496  ORF Transcript_22497/g.69496 Transcript_22497/m.69496 type:complete len:627 (-) Transcript_22497:453-2333(-)
MSRSEPPPVALDVETRGSDFVDFQGRRVTLRGVNLAGGKWPANQPTVKREGFFDAEPSYVGRPFPLADAPSHFRRLRAWGCNVARLTVTWDAIEHAGPGVYDEAYIEYVVEIVRCAGRFGVTVVVDPHQDVWSRYSGGSGAPAWTFAKVGLDVTKFEASGAALVHATRGDPFPRMCWPTNKDKLACFTMFTIFFGGDRFAPDLEIDGEPAQRFLQRHYIAALGTLAAALKDEANVAGFGSMNEPLPGLIGRKRLDRIAGPLRNEHMPTPLEAMALGAGVPRLVREFSVSSLKSLALGAPVGTVSMNEEKTSAWLPGADCVWRAHGIWRVDDRGEPELLKPAYFDVGREYFGDQCMKPFVAAYAEEIRSRGHARWRIFVELPPADLDLCAFPDFSDGRGGPAKLPDGSGGAYVHSPHWYDQLTLFFGRYRPYVAIDAVSGQPAFGRGAVKGLHRRQIAELQGEAAKFGTAPTFVGETGVPFDVDGRAWYRAAERVPVGSGVAMSFEKRRRSQFNAARTRPRRGRKPAGTRRPSRPRPRRRPKRRSSRRSARSRTRSKRSRRATSRTRSGATRRRTMRTNWETAGTPRTCRCTPRGRAPTTSPSNATRPACTAAVARRARSRASSAAG